MTGANEGEGLVAEELMLDWNGSALLGATGPGNVATACCT